MSSTLVNTKIVINEPIKQKIFGYTIILDKKCLDYLTIKARSYNGKSEGKAGRILRNGQYVLHGRHMPKLNPLLNTPDMIDKINLTLDLVYGKSRKEIAKLVRDNMTKFNRNIQLPEPRKRVKKDRK